MCARAEKRLSVSTGQGAASIHKCTIFFFSLSTVVEPDDYPGSRPVSLRYVDFVALLPMNMRDPMGVGGGINPKFLLMSLTLLHLIETYMGALLF